MEITPPHWQMSLELLFRAGYLPTSTVGEPGAQGAVMTGTQGAGANITGGGFTVAGFAGQEHMPKGGIFAMGLLSIMVAMGLEDARAVTCEFTINVEGATPKGHCSIAPMHTQIPIAKPSSPL